METTAYVPTADDLDFLDTLTDLGAWHNSRVTHWHLWRDETATNARDRFERDRIHSLVMNPAGVATEPREALRWLVSQQCEAMARASSPERVAAHRGWRTREDWEERVRFSWHVMTHGWLVPSGCGMQTRDGHTVMIYVEPMTPGDCSRRHPATSDVESSGQR